ncbi:hypothetical protein F8M41_013136 [Gigaspora margarita]|uniref:Uncharacterized protein n=1 Tax=Gigaspora margarita TaxID=4874 RepID=A0A8H4A0L9_GIGMA|nr:hypothetical protein F8M41_013136 [Gigaspora margarita]
MKHISKDGTIHEQRTVTKVVKDTFWSLYFFILFFFQSLISPSAADNMRNGNHGGSGGSKRTGRPNNYVKSHNFACGSCGS